MIDFYKTYEYHSWIIVDCVWGSWDIGECSKSCGGGTQTNIRKPNVTAAHGGEECYGSASVTESCNTQECPGKYI